ncbi:hypothetical protein PLESTF_001286000 [Pleodorina starrii]|nr:hypothetical protein PLESTM_001484200 [Pleodorina starrii]GLC72721.1 hypothetical protein PLESTF_001286000 [Pleodorina starrii]
MEDFAVYTSYYSHYHVRAAEAAAAVQSVPRKRHGVVCAFLAFGAACGMATVAVGFVAHNPAVIWSVVSVGLIGVIAGLVLAHRQATGGWVWGASPAHAPAPSQRGSSGQAAAVAVGSGGSTAAAGGLAGGFQLPMYCADAFDVEMGFAHPLPSLSAAAIKTGSAAYVCGDADGHSGGSDGIGSSGSSDGDSASELKADGHAAAGPAAAAVAVAAAAAECGAVMCGFPLPGADGWIDTRPVLVLQPHPHLLHQSDEEVRTGRCGVGTGEASEAAAPNATPSCTSSNAAAEAAVARWPPADPQDRACDEAAPGHMQEESTPERSEAPSPLPLPLPSLPSPHPMEP